MITQLKEVLEYNTDTGIFTWIGSPAKNVAIGDMAGTPDKDGYIMIRINRRRYMAHRLAILYTDGYMPELTVDHIDRIPWHNWRLNLREASYQCQNRNCGMNTRNTSGIKGISWHKMGGRWIAKICVDRRYKSLGLYDTLLDASYARFAAEQCLGFQDCDLNSSAKMYIEQHKGEV